MQKKSQSFCSCALRQGAGLLTSKGKKVPFRGRGSRNSLGGSGTGMAGTMEIDIRRVYTFNVHFPSTGLEDSNYIASS